MLKKTIVLLVFLSVFVVACAGSATETPAERGIETLEEPVDSTPVSTAVSTIPAASPSPGSTMATEQADANCTVVSRQPTPGPTEQSLVPPVSDDDWTHGPDDAAVTFIEYGDFQ